MKPLLIPTILAKTEEEAREKTVAVSRAPWIQIDCVDGKFAKNTTWYDAKAAARWKIRPKIELDLMVRDPERVIRAWRNVKNVKRVFWHVEAKVDHEKLIKKVGSWKLEVGLALNPDTPLTAVAPFLDQVDGVLLLGVRPGKSGQKMRPGMLQKVAALHKGMPHLPISFDGGLDAKNIKTFAKAGVSRLCMGSAIFGAKEPDQERRKLQKRFS